MEVRLPARLVAFIVYISCEPAAAMLPQCQKLTWLTGCTCRRLEDPENPHPDAGKELHLELPYPLNWRRFSSIAELRSAGEWAYLEPQSGSFPAVDAVILRRSTDPPLLIQATIALSHTISDKVVDVLDEMPPDVTPVFVFAVPDPKARRWKRKQMYSQGSSKVSRIATASRDVKRMLKDMPQMVLVPENIDLIPAEPQPAGADRQGRAAFSRVAKHILPRRSDGKIISVRLFILHPCCSLSFSLPHELMRKSGNRTQSPLIYKTLQMHSPSCLLTGSALLVAEPLCGQRWMQSVVGDLSRARVLGGQPDCPAGGQGRKHAGLPGFQGVRHQVCSSPCHLLLLRLTWTNCGT